MDRNTEMGIYVEYPRVEYRRRSGNAVGQRRRRDGMAGRIAADPD
jgi:hypothetical protein